MSTTPKDDGGAAFPNITPDMPVVGSPGMTLRDYFAAAAMTGFLADSAQRLVAQAVEESDEGKHIADTAPSSPPTAKGET